MSVNRCVACRPRQLLIILVRYVLTGFRLAVPLRQPEIDYVHNMRRFFRLKTHQEVVGFDISVQKVIRVQEFEALEDLVGKEKHRF